MIAPDPAEPSEEPAATPKRRKRYRGTHPRRFDEKYKEHAADRYPEEVEKVITSGKTPAGAHRPICVDEILEVLAPAPGEIGLDATLGAGGHAQEILQRLSGGRLIGLDADPLELPRAEARLRALGFGEDQFTAVHANFAAIPKVLATQGVPAVDFVLADLGCSSMQLDDPSRGFSYKHDGPLDLRLNPTRGQPASELIARLSAEQIETLLREASDEPCAMEIAAAIVVARQRSPLRSTTQLAAAVASGAARGGGEVRRAQARTFQAIRIAVNDEYGTLDALLRALPWILAPGGRVAILAFHSGEDRRVKHAFRDGLRDGLYDHVAPDVIRPSRREVAANPRASSAKLRWARRSRPA